MKGVVDAIEHGNISVLNAYIANGGNADGDDPISLLAFACQKGTADTVRFLLEHKANPDWRAPYGYGDWSLLDYAAEQPEKAWLIPMLLQAGADVRGSPVLFYSPIDAALKCGHVTHAKYLLYAGAKLRTAKTLRPHGETTRNILLTSFNTCKTLAAHTYVALLRGWRWPRDLARLMVRVLWEVRFEFSE